MGIMVEVGGYAFQAADYTVTEEATPLAGNDSSGGVGSVVVDIPMPDPHLPHDQENTGWARIRKFGPDFLDGQTIEIFDSRKGVTSGVIDGVSVDWGNAMMRLTAVSRLGLVAVYNVQAQPYVGTLGGAFNYYMGLAGLANQGIIDPALANRSVAYPGWYGELWYHMKMMAAVEACEITLVSGEIMLRPLRTRQASLGRQVEMRRDVKRGTIAMAMEVYQYNNKAITDAQVWPLVGEEAPQVLSVNAGESAEYVLELSSSVSSIRPLTHASNINTAPTTVSPYQIITDAGVALTTQQWLDVAGTVTAEIDPDTQHITVKLSAGYGTNKDGTPVRSYSLGRTVRGYGSTQPALIIRGTGVAFTRERRLIHTGANPLSAAADIAATIDNPFASKATHVGRISSRAAIGYSGGVATISGSAISVNRLGDSGHELLPTNAEVKAALTAAAGGSLTTAAAKTFFNSLGLTSYRQINQYYADMVQGEFENQVYGNVNGARIWDEESRRWYRIRSADVSPTLIQFEAEDDTTCKDVQTFYAGKTYAELQAIFNGLTFQQIRRLGLFNG